MHRWICDNGPIKVRDYIEDFKTLQSDLCFSSPDPLHLRSDLFMIANALSSKTEPRALFSSSPKIVDSTLSVKPKAFKSVSFKDNLTTSQLSVGDCSMATTKHIDSTLDAKRKSSESVNFNDDCNTSQVSTIGGLTMVARNQEMKVKRACTEMKKAKNELKKNNYEGKLVKSGSTAANNTKKQRIHYNRIQGQKAASVAQVKCRTFKKVISNLSDATIKSSSMGSYVEKEANQCNPRTKVVTLIMDELVPKPQGLSYLSKMSRDTPSCIVISGQDQGEAKAVLEYFVEHEDQLKFVNSTSACEEIIFGTKKPPVHRIGRMCDFEEEIKENKMGNCVDIMKTPLIKGKDQEQDQKTIMDLEEFFQSSRNS